MFLESPEFYLSVATESDQTRLQALTLVTKPAPMVFFIHPNMLVGFPVRGGTDLKWCCREGGG